MFTIFLTIEDPYASAIVRSIRFVIVDSVAWLKIYCSRGFRIETVKIMNVNIFGSLMHDKLSFLEHGLHIQLCIKTTHMVETCCIIIHVWGTILWIFSYNLQLWGNIFRCPTEKLQTSIVCIVIYCLHNVFMSLN